MKFTHIHNNEYGNEIESISMELHEHASLSDALDTFTRFLRAVGFHFEGSVDIVDHEAEFDYALEEQEKFDYIEAYDQIDDDLLKANADWPFPLSTKP